MIFNNKLSLSLWDTNNIYMVIYEHLILLFIMCSDLF